MNPLTIKSTVILLIGICSTLSAFAEGGETRNGGNSVVCYTDRAQRQIQSVELFDHWEGDHYYPITDLDGKVYARNLGGDSLSVSQKIELFMKRVEKYDRYAAMRYRQYAELLLTDLKDFIVPSIPGNPVDDDHPVGIPAPPCYKKQFAVQIRNPDPGTRRFQIDATLFRAASKDAQAGILLHEIVYRDAIQIHSAKNSDGVRLLTYFYSTPAVESMEPSEVQHIYQRAGIKSPILSSMTVYSVRLQGWNQNILVSWKDPAELKNGERGNFWLRSRMNLKNSAMNLQMPRSDNYDWTRRSGGANVELMKVNGAILLVGLSATGPRMPSHFIFRMNDQTVSPEEGGSMIALFSTQFDEAGFPNTLSVNDLIGQPAIHVMGAKCSHHGAGGFQMYRGKVIGCFLADGEAVQHRLRDRRLIEVSGRVQFYPSGRVLSGNFKKPTAMRVYGSDQTYQFQGLFTASENERITRGTLLESGTPYREFNRVLSSEIRLKNNNDSLYVVQPRTLYRFSNEMRFIKTGDSTYLRTLCEKIHGSTNIRYSSYLAFFPETIRGTRQFLGTKAWEPVSVTDDRVQLSEGFQCEHTSGERRF